MRQDAENAEDYFTELFSRQVAPLRAQVISVVGERDPGTEYYQERFREWGESSYFSVTISRIGPTFCAMPP